MTDVEKDIAAVEAVKQERLLKRSQKQFQKTIQAKKEKQEKLVAPVILTLTLVVSVILWLVFKR